MCRDLRRKRPRMHDRKPYRQSRMVGILVRRRRRECLIGNAILLAKQGYILISTEIYQGMDHGGEREPGVVGRGGDWAHRPVESRCRWHGLLDLERDQRDRASGCRL